MTMIGNLQQQLAGAAGLKILPPNWTPAPLKWERQIEQPLPGYLRRARAAVAAHPHNPLAHARLAQAAQASDEPEEARDAARRALDLGLDGGEPAAVHAALSVLESGGHGRELAPLLDDRRSARLPTNLRLRAAIGAGEHAAAVGLASDPRAAAHISPDAHALLAWVHLERGEFGRAVSEGRRAQAAGSSGVALYANLGYAHAALGQLSKAIKLTRQARALAPLHRGVGFNLALYLKLAGDHDAALDALDRVRYGERTDIQLALAIANVEVYAGNMQRARRVLQRVRASQEWTLADRTRRSELEANLAFLRWKLREADFHTTITSMRRALSATEYESVSTAYLLANLLLQTDQAPLLEGLIDRLQTRHPQAELDGLRVALALLQHDAQAAVELARRWSAHDVLNPNAAAMATYLVADLEGDFARAAEIGMRALGRAPSHRGLINNTAYALALAGEPERARKLLAGLGDCKRVELVATRALVELLLGSTERGLAGYRRAWDLARSAGDDALADRVLANVLLARACAGLPNPPMDVALADRLAKAADSQPATWVGIQRLQRELRVGISLSAEGDGAEDCRAQHSGLFALGSCPTERPSRRRHLPPGSDVSRPERSGE